MPASDLQKKWAERIERAKKVKEDWKNEFKVDLGRAYFEGKQNPGYPEDEWITVNKIYSHLQAQLPLLYSMDPYFYVKLKKSFSPLSAEDLAMMQQTGQTPPVIVAMEQKGRARQAMLNYLKGELELKEKARLSIHDAHFAFGVCKVRRASDEEEHPNAGEPIVDEQGNELKDPETGETLTYPDTRPVNERYELIRVHPDDFLFDEDAGPLRDTWKWVAQHVRMTKADALADPRFKGKAKVIREINGKSRDQKKQGVVRSGLSEESNQLDDDELFIDTWEIYDHKNREWLVMAEDADDLLIDPRSLPPGIERDPFAILRFTLRDSSPYPIPPVSPAIDPQKEYSLSRSRLLTHRKRFNRKYEVDVTRLDDPDNEISKLESGDDGTIIKKTGPGAVVEPIKDAPLDQQNLQEILMLNGDIIEIMGTPDNSRGIASADSATEASLLDKRLEIREGDRLSMVVDFVLAIARKLDMLVQFHIDEDEAVKITGPQGVFWQTVKKEDYEEIQGEFEYSVNVGASQPRLPDIERAQWIAFMSQVVIPFPHILTSPAIMKRMAEMFHIEDEAALEEFRQLGLKIMAGTMPMPGGQGGGPSDNPIAQVLGAALGPQGGNANGGGAQQMVQ